VKFFCGSNLWNGPDRIQCISWIHFFTCPFQTASHHISGDVYTSYIKDRVIWTWIICFCKAESWQHQHFKFCSWKENDDKLFLWNYRKNHWKEKIWSYLSLLKVAFLNAIHLFSNWKYNDSRKFPLQITTEFFLLEDLYQVKLQKCYDYMSSQFFTIFPKNHNS